MIRPQVKVPVIAQRKRWDCGAACLAMVCNALGLRVTLETCRSRLNCSHGPANVRDLVEVSNGLGLQARAYFMRDLQSIFTLHTPAVLHTTTGHFVVLASVCYEERSIEIVDPAVGRLMGRPATDADTHEFFSGAFVTFSPLGRGTRVEDVSSLAVCWDRLCSIPILAARRLRSEIVTRPKIVTASLAALLSRRDKPCS